MTSGISGPEPIYDSVLDEHGDAPAAARQAAEAVERQADRLLDFNGPGRSLDLPLM